MRLTRRTAGCLLASTLLRAATPEWPRFRGPESNPAVPKGNLPEKWSTTENIEWVASIPGRGWSSPIVSGRRVFVTAATTDGKSKLPQIGTEYSNEYVAELMKQGLSQEEVMKRVNERDIEKPHEVTLHYHLHCIDLESGKTTWSKEFYTGRPPGGRHRKNSFTSETPITDGERVYVYVANLGLYAFDMKGKLVWQQKLEAFPIYLDFGTGGSPALVDNLLVVVNDNEKQQIIAAFDKRSGKQVWRKDRDLGAGSERSMRSGWVTPFIWKTPQRTEIVTIGPATAVSYDTDGKELWRLNGMTPAPIPSPFVYDGLLILNGGRSKALFAVKPGATGDITPAEGKTNDFIAWTQPRGGTYLPTGVAYDGAIYGLSEIGIFSRYDAKTGKLSYRSRIENGIAFTSSPWAYNGRIFCLNEEGKTFVIEAGEQYKLLAVNNLDEMAQATPAIVGDRLLLRTETHLYSIRNRKR
jgi:outer membrane protein assembly factor BamB